MALHTEAVIPPDGDAMPASRRAGAHVPPAHGPVPEPDEGGWAGSIDLTPPRRWVYWFSAAVLAAWAAAGWFVVG